MNIKNNRTPFLGPLKQIGCTDFVEFQCTFRQFRCAHFQNFSSEKTVVRPRGDTKFTLPPSALPTLKTTNLHVIGETFHDSFIVCKR